jgi:hypothetical protein
MRNISVVQTAESSWVPSGPYGLDMHCIYTHTGTKELSLLPVTPDRARNPSKNNRTHPKTLDLLSSTPRIMWCDVISLRSITLHNPHYWISSWRAVFSSTHLFTSVYIRRYECISSSINPPCNSPSSRRKNKNLSSIFFVHIHFSRDLFYWCLPLSVSQCAWFLTFRRRPCHGSDHQRHLLISISDPRLLWPLVFSRGWIWFDDQRRPIFPSFFLGKIWR